MSDQIAQLRNLTSQLGIPPETTKPTSVLPGPDAQITDTATELYRLGAAQGSLYLSNSRVCRIKSIPGGSLPVLEPLDPSSARSEFEKLAFFAKRRATMNERTVMNESDARAILSCDAARNHLPNISGLLSAPIPVLRGGTVHNLGSGYDAGTGLLVAGGSINEPASLDEAVLMIQSVINDFRFQTEADKSRAIAALLTPAMKMGGFINGNIPVDVVEADQSQTGKGFFVELRAKIYGEKPVLVPVQQGGVGSLDESIGSALLKGRPFVSIDNLRGNLRSQSLEAFLTSSGPFSVRIPYSPAQYIEHTNFFISITSNGLQTTPDLANRASFIRLLKDPDPQFIEVNGKGIDELIETLQARYIGSVATIIRAWHQRGMPRTGENRHSFREWAQKLDWIVQNIFALPPLLNGNDEAVRRVQSQNIGFLHELAAAAQGHQRTDQWLLATELAELCDNAGITIPGLTGRVSGREYPSNQKGQRIGQIMKDALDTERTLTLSPFQLEREEIQGLSPEGNSQRLKRYRFSRLAPGIPIEPQATTNGTADTL